jgi:hypothetical protein
MPEALEELIAIGTAPEGQALTLTGLFGQTPPVGTPAIAVVPGPGHLLRPPERSGLTALGERIMPGFQDTC